MVVFMFVVGLCDKCLLGCFCDVKIGVVELVVC